LHQTIYLPIDHLAVGIEVYGLTICGQNDSVSILADDKLGHAENNALFTSEIFLPLLFQEVTAF